MSEEKNKTLRFKAGDRVFDIVRLQEVSIEKIDEAGYLVLDASLGKSTQTIVDREKYIKEHGTDDRYSISIQEAIDTLDDVPHD